MLKLELPNIWYKECVMILKPDALPWKYIFNRL